VTSPDHEVRRLAEEGYSVALLDGTLVISHVPYVRAAGCVGRADLLVPLAMEGSRVVAPRAHQAWWTGTAPKETDGTPLKGISVQRGAEPCVTGMPPATMLCGRIRGREFRDHLEFVSTYVALLGAPAIALDPDATACARTRSIPVAADAGPFAYADTASSRSAMGAINARVRGRSVGIVGLGGTGSYVLDLVSKCAVGAIHLFDDDVFEQHSAFRAPGAATLDDLRARRRKVEHFADVYRGIHRGVVPHAVRIDRGTAPLLDPLDFVFLCIDEAAAKPPILARLAERGIPFVDVGMGLHGSDRGIAGALRTTLVTPDDRSMLDRIPIVGDPDGVYATNIQICELNALNASLAVIAWKRHLGFYAADRTCSNEVFVVDGGRLHSEASPVEVRADEASTRSPA
jgi:molybdopterin/thiamine biosynthesis adenylyltransferase